MSYRITLFKILLLSLLLASSSAKAEINIISTIKPLQFIAQAIVGDLGSAKAIISANDSPHHFNLTPSNRLLAAQADLFIWIGPVFEAHLAEDIDELSGAKVIITALEVETIQTHKLGQTATVDGHIWLSPFNSIQLANRIFQELVNLDSQNTEQYRLNLDKFTQSMAELTIAVGSLIEDTKQSPFIVYHNGFQYFEKEYNVEHVLALVADPETSPSIRQLIQTRKKIAELDPVCVLSDADANPQLIDTFLEGRILRQHKIDLLGSNIANSTSAYKELIEHVAAQFVKCISSN